MADLKQAYRALDPARSAEGAIYVPRPGDSVGILREEFQIRTSPLRVLLGGQRGVGKTTELCRLRELIRPGRVGCMVRDLAGMSMEKACREMIRGLTEQVGMTWEQARETFALQDRITPDMFSGIVDYLNQSPPPLLLCDGLEKASPTTAEEFIVAYRAVPAHLVLVAPIPLLLAPEFSSTVSEWDRVLFLPAISVHTRDGTPDEAGVNYMLHVIGQRVGEGVFAEDALRFLIGASAGLHRELLSLAQQACMRAAIAGQSQVTLLVAQSTVNDKRHEYSFHLTPQDLEYMYHVSLDKRITGDPSALSLINRNLIVSYQDDSSWFDVHPIVQPLVRRGRKTS